MRAALVLCLLFLGLAPAPAHAAMFQPESFTLANGMQVVVLEDRRAPVVTHMVWYRTGSADEVQGKSGIAHFLEHLMFKGTREVKPGDFSRIVARNGGRDNAFTSYDYTGYFQDVARDRLELVMKMEADRMQNLVLTDAEVLPERDVILEERRSRTDNNPRALLGEQMTAAQYLNHPYGRPVIGWEHEMRQLSTADAIAWHQRYYTPNNAFLIVAGDIDAAELRPLAEKYYGPLQARPVVERTRPQEPPQIAPRRIVLEDSRVRQASWSRSYLAPTRTGGETRHAVPLEVLSEILSGRTGRFERALAKSDGPATSVGAGYDSSGIDPMTFSIYASPRPGTELAVLEAAVDREIATLLKDGVTEAEVTRARTGLIASATYARDSAASGARMFGAGLVAGLTIAQIEEWPDLVRAVTVADVNLAARYVLEPGRSVTGLLLPKKGD